MERKIYHIFTAIVIAVLSLNFAFATSPPKQTSIKLYEVTRDSGKKRIPPQRFIQCEVIDDMIFFDPNFEYDCMSVEITGAEISGVIERRFTIFEPYVIIPQLSGECTIRCTTETGAVYEGSIVL